MGDNRACITLDVSSFSSCCVSAFHTLSLISSPLHLIFNFALFHLISPILAISISSYVVFAYLFFVATSAAMIAVPFMYLLLCANGTASNADNNAILCMIASGTHVCDTIVNNSEMSGSVAVPSRRRRFSIS